MSFAIEKWFKYKNETLLIEGLSDIGLLPRFVEKIENHMPDASEKSRVWIGNALKQFGPLRNTGFNVRLDKFTELMQPFDAGEYNILSIVGKEYINGKVAKWRKAKKSFVKSAKKHNINQEEIDKVLDFLSEYEEGVWEYFYRQIQNTILVMNRNPDNYEKSILYVRSKTDENGRVKREYTNYKSIPPSDLWYAENLSKKYLMEIEDPEDIVYKFEDGAFWYDIGSTRCEIERVRMGHCGDSEAGDMGGGILYSLRKRSKNEAFSQSFVTLAYRQEDKTITQIKGRRNLAPPDVFWPYIAKFIEFIGAEVCTETGKYSDDSPQIFQSMQDYLEQKTGIEFADSESLSAERELREECESYQEWLRGHENYPQITHSGLDIHGMDQGVEPAIWDDGISSICAEVPFEITALLIASLGADDVVQEQLMEILEENDSNDILSYATRWVTQPSMIFVKADNFSSAMRKAERIEVLEPDQAAYGQNSYVVVRELDEVFSNYKESLDQEEESDYDSFVESFVELVGDLEESIDEIEEYLIEVDLLEKTEQKKFQETAKSFDSFEVNEEDSSSRETVLYLKDRLLQISTQEADSLVVNLKLFSNILRPNYSLGGYSTNAEFTELVLNAMRQEQDAAIEFAKKQMQFDFGEKYEQKIETIWDKIDGNLKQIIWEKCTPAVTYKTYRGTDEHYIDFIFQIVIENSTLSVLRPFIQFYDKNPELIIKAVKDSLIEIIKTEIKAKGLNLNERTSNPLDVRLYEIDFVMSYPLGQGFEMTDIHNIVRAIPDVTTIRTIGNAKKTQENRTISLQRLKFALRGRKPREEWVRQVLLPQVRKINRNIRIHKVEKADLVSSSTQRLEEYYAAFSQRQSAARTTPAPSVQSLIDDWVEGGVMYDQPTNLNLTRYSVMMPVSDLEHLCSRQPRKHGHHFDAGYQNFIQNGPRDPIYIAIGKNGRAKITGNEDDLRYAIKAGVEEVPVFISYQRQV